MIKSVAALAVSSAMLLSFPVCAETVSSAPNTGSVVQEDAAWLFLEERPAGRWNIVVNSLGGRAPQENAEKQLTITLENGTGKGFTTAADLELGIISLVKLGQDPENYQKANLVSMLYAFDDLYRDGLEGVYLALSAYEAGQFQPSDSARNSIPSLIDYIVSSQQRSGGFAARPGYDSDVQTTARVVLALYPYESIPYVRESVDKAIGWLATRQNVDGTFSIADTPDCETTATVITALRSAGVAADDARFLKGGSSLSSVLERFRSGDGGFAAIAGGDGDVNATEAALIALCTDKTGLSPYLAPDKYPGYAAPVPEEQDNMQIFIKFLLGFFIMFGIVYLLLILTGKIGKMWGKFPEPTEQPSSENGDNLSDSDSHTLELHIPMKAEVPNFDDLPEHDLFSRRTDKPE